MLQSNVKLWTVIKYWTLSLSTQSVDEGYDKTVYFRGCLRVNSKQTKGGFTRPIP